MSNAEHDRRIDYVEFPCTHIEKTKRFFEAVFGWKFEDYGPDYTSFHDGRLGGGFSKTPRVDAGGPLVVIYTSDLFGMRAKIKAAGGKIVKKTFSFPGGRRFHFSDPSGNVLAVWSDVAD